MIKTQELMDENHDKLKKFSSGPIQNDVPNVNS